MATPVRSQHQADAAIEQMVEIIRAGWDPVQIILFGSRARGDHHEHSDVDLLVVLDEVEDGPRQRSEIEQALACANTPRDIKLATPEQVVRQATVAGTVERAAMVEGRTLHVRGGGDPVNEAVMHWLEMSRRDLRGGRNQMAADPTEPAIACYHAQQAIEKTFKAALVAERIDPPRTHDLNELRDLLPEDWQSPATRAALKRISNWAVASRYSLDSEDFTDDIASWGIETAQAIHDAIAAECSRRGTAVD